MTPHFDPQPNSQKSWHSCPAPFWNLTNPNPYLGVPDMLKRDRFELLSAYLDGEVSASESKQVEEWLDTDPSVQCLYQRLLKLRRGFQTLPTPQEDHLAREMVSQVMERLNQPPKKTAWWWGGGAIAAAVIAAVSSAISNPGQLIPQIAKSPIPQEMTPVMRIALDQPLITIPKSEPSPLVVPNATGDLHKMLNSTP